MSSNIPNESSKKRHFLLVAITGGIASGKSTVALNLQSPEIKLIDADSLAKIAVDQVPGVLEAIVQAFGAKVLDQNQRLNRSLMAEIIFSDSRAKEKLEAIIHPEVQNLLQAELLTIPQSVKIVIYLIPLLVEANVDCSRFDLIVSVLTEPEIALERIIKRDNCSKELALKKIKSQASNDQKLKISDYTIFNNGSLLDLKENVRYFAEFLKGRIPC